MFCNGNNQSEKGEIYSDQTGIFLYQLSRGNKCIFILYNYDSNLILKEELKDRIAGSLTKAWKNTFDRLTHNGHTTQLHVLDNEILAEFTAVLDTEKIQY